MPNVVRDELDEFDRFLFRTELIVCGAEPVELVLEFELEDEAFIDFASTEVLS
jgi:hypothetical protein